MYIKVLGPGCPNCQRVETVARSAVAKLGVDATVEKVTAYQDIMRYPIMATPGLVIDEKLVCAGRIPNEAEVTAWIRAAS